MKKTLFLSFCAAFLIFSCSPVTIEEDDPGRGGRGDGDDDPPGSDREGIGEQIKNICEGDGYTVYSYGECPDGTGIGTYDEDGIGEEDSLIKPPQPVDIFFVLNSHSSMWYYLTYLTSLENNTRFQKRFQSFLPILDENNMDWRMFFTNASYSDGLFANGKSGGYFKKEMVKLWTWKQDMGY